MKLEHYTLTPDQIRQGTEAAERAKLADDVLQALLTRHASGDNEATSNLQRGLEWLVWDRFGRHRPSKYISAADVLGTMMVDLAEAIERITDPVSPAEAIRRIRNHLNYSANHFAEELSPAPRVKSHSARVSRLSQVEVNPVNTDYESSVLEDPTAELPTVCPNGKPYRVPSRYANAMPDTSPEDDDERETTYQRLEPFAQSSHERQVLLAYRDGTPLPSGVSNKQASTAFARLERRAA